MEGAFGAKKRGFTIFFVVESAILGVVLLDIGAGVVGGNDGWATYCGQVL